MLEAVLVVPRVGRKGSKLIDKELNQSVPHSDEACW